MNAVVAAVAVLLLGLGASCGNGTSLPDSTPDATPDSTPKSDGITGSDAPVGDAPAGGQYCPVVGYSACGGDLVGTWVFRDVCPEDPAAAAALCEHPYDDRPECIGTGNEAICDGTHTGTLTFKADGKVDVDTQVTLIATWSFTDTCLAAVASTGTTAEERCKTMGSDKLTCVYNSRCTCVGDPMTEGDKTTATYKIAGQDLTIGEDPPASYCIDGDRLTMDYYVFHPVSWRYWVLERDKDLP